MISKKQFCVVLGGGGNAAMLIDSLRAAGLDIVRAVLDKNQDMWGTNVLDVPVIGGDERLPELVRQGADCFVVGLGTIGIGAARKRLFETGIAAGLEPLTVIHPSAVVMSSAKLGRGCQLMPRSVVNARATLGDNVLVNTGAIVEHDCTVGNHVHLATGAQLAGGVSVGEKSLVGLDACVRQGVRVGRLAIVGAGAAALRDVPDNAVVVGVPARILRYNQ